MNSFEIGLPLAAAMAALITIAWSAAPAEGQTARKRRIIYNDDGGVLKHMATPDVDAMLAKRIKPLVGTQVDTVFYCGHDDFAKVFYDSKIEGVEMSGSAGLRQSLKDGVDPNRELIEFCRKNRLEVLWSFRMNDIHDSYGGRLGKFKSDHPEWLLGGKDAKNDKRSVKAGTWSSLDFAVPEVRDHVAACIREVYEKYELDGAEFDYGRNASLFRPTFEERPVGPEHLAILTEFQRTLREMGREIERRRGKPFLLAAVVPETVELCRFVGMDIERWLAEGLIDMVIVGNGYVPFSVMTMRELIELGRRHRVPVYPRLNVNTGDRLFWRHIEAWRGAAMNFWHCGGDGVYLFNAYDNKNIGDSHPLTQPLGELGDLKTLAGLDKLFAADIDLETAGYGFGDVRFYVPRGHLVPMSLTEPGAFVHFYVGEDLRAARAAGLEPTIELRLAVAGFGAEPAPTLKLNGQPLSDGAFEADKLGSGWFTFRIDPGRVKLGVNKIQGQAGSQLGKDASPRLVRVELWIRYAAR